ncbi:MAG: GAF domain-containing sensor histidine kinase [Myxococcota bacterium]
MGAAPLPADEEQRLRTLYAHEILDTVEEQGFDDVCRLAASVCDTPISLVTLVDRRRQWFKARVGLDEKETERDCSFCAHAILEGDLMVVPDAAQDARFADNRLVLSSPHIRFYAGTPLVAHDGQPLGSLCVLDDRPRRLDEDQLASLRALGRQVEAQLEMRRAQHDKDILGRFVVHDLRNLLTSMLFNARQALSVAEQDEIPLEDLRDLREAVDLSHRRVDDFHTLLASERDTVPMSIEQVDIARIVEGERARLKHRLAEQRVSLVSSLQAPILQADPDLLRRVLENLLHNALDVAPVDTAIRVETWAEDNHAFLRVSDEGPGVAEDERDSIFDIDRSGTKRTTRGSTGLGLAFCRMSTRTMGGSIRYDDPATGKGAAFLVTLPRG